MTSSKTHHTFLQSLEAMAEQASESGLSLRDILDRLDERAFGAALFILALPCAIPFLYGVPQAVSLPMIALAVQMLSGREEPWLPDRLGVRMIDRSNLQRISAFGRKWFGWVEIFAKPRLLWMSGQKAERGIAVFLTLFCASILLPFPGTNTMPGIAVAIVAFGLMARDGLLILVGLFFGNLWLGILLSVFGFGLRSATGL